FLHHGEFLSLANLLYDDLFRSLCGNASEIILRFKREDDLFSGRSAALYELGVSEENVFLRVEAGEFSLSEVLLFVMKRVCMAVRVFLREFFAGHRETHRGLVDDGFHLFKGDRAGIEVEFRANDLAALPVFTLV